MPGLTEEGSIRLRSQTIPQRFKKPTTVPMPHGLKGTSIWQWYCASLRKSNQIEKPYTETRKQTFNVVPALH